MTFLGVLSWSCACPDLAYLGITIELNGVQQSEDVLITATRQGQAAPSPGCDGATWTACSLDEGVYDISFSSQGNLIGELSGVCSPGNLTGCDAEEAEEETGPVAVVTQGADFTVALSRNGACP